MDHFACSPNPHNQDEVTATNQDEAAATNHQLLEPPRPPSAAPRGATSRDEAAAPSAAPRATAGMLFLRVEDRLRSMRWCSWQRASMRSWCADVVPLFPCRRHREWQPQLPPPLVKVSDGGLALRGRWRDIAESWPPPSSSGGMKTSTIKMEMLRKTQLHSPLEISFSGSLVLKGWNTYLLFWVYNLDHVGGGDPKAKIGLIHIKNDIKIAISNRIS
jgi:hypothetical protein